MQALACADLGEFEWAFRPERLKIQLKALPGRPRSYARTRASCAPHNLHRSQPAPHSPRLTARASQPAPHSPRLTARASQPASHGPRLTARASQPAPHSPRPLTARAGRILVS
ncbi:hypothetical protein Ani05nite_67640 [Amorphoplanes nipponensis]|uniref:Uncharacterized protein n=1 Tax=Actinoplanes nipponensis TaxID=135950 RepID=A0A919JPS0_9ACTN|nr:hypothetical protein Ani05nite_67640 [Actinoplanes nipponensis]